MADSKPYPGPPSVPRPPSVPTPLLEKRETETMGSGLFVPDDDAIVQILNSTFVGGEDPVALYAGYAIRPQSKLWNIIPDECTSNGTKTKTYPQYAISLKSSGAPIDLSVVTPSDGCIDHSLANIDIATDPRVLEFFSEYADYGDRGAWVGFLNQWKGMGVRTNAMYANEASPSSVNCEMKYFHDPGKIASIPEMSLVFAGLYLTKEVVKGDQILWFYGDSYPREYDLED